MKSKDTVLEIIFRLGILGLVAALILIAQTFSRDSRMLPQIVGGTIIALVLLSFVIDIFAKPGLKSPNGDKKETTANGTAGAASGRKRLYLSALVILVSLSGVCIAGIIVAVPATFITFALVLGGRKDLVRAVGISFIMTAAVYVTFKYMLNIPLFRGLLSELGLF